MVSWLNSFIEGGASLDERSSDVVHCHLCGLFVFDHEGSIHDDVFYVIALSDIDEMA